MLMKLICFLFFLTQLQAIFVGNPSDPGFYRDGLISSGKKKWVSLRMGYVSECVYKARCKDEFEQIDSIETNISMKNYLGVLTLNIVNHLDIYGFAGSSRMRVDQTIYPKREPSWGIGAKGLLLKFYHAHLGLDVKYFHTDIQPTFFVVEGMLAPLITDLTMDYEETQVALALSYPMGLFIPYAGATYLYCKLKPNTMLGLLELPSMNLLLDFDTTAAVSANRWGLVLGATLISQHTMTINVESRLIDQMAVNVSADLRF